VTIYDQYIAVKRITVLIFLDHINGWLLLFEVFPTFQGFISLFSFVFLPETLGRWSAMRGGLTLFEEGVDKTTAIT
jgi:hypothetical protein